MKYKIVILTSIFLFGVGCVSSSINNQDNKSSQSAMLEINNADIPSDEVLLPKNKTWQRVAIKNFSNPYSVEIHPWWFWLGTNKELKAGGAVFASNAGLFADVGRDKSGTKIIWYSHASSGIETINTVIASAMIKECNVLRKTINGFEVCAGNVKDKDSFIRAVAFKKDENYVWQPMLDYGMPFESGLGYFLHMLSTFKSEIKETTAK